MADNLPDDPLWDAHESPYIRWLVERYSAFGMERFGQFQSELQKWIVRDLFKPAIPRPVIPAYGAWTADDLTAIEAYLESVPPGAMSLDDWMLCVDYLYHRYVPPAAMMEATEYHVVKSHVMGRVAAQMPKIISPERAMQIAMAAPYSLATVKESFPAVSPVQRASIEFATQRSCERVVQLSENARMDMRKIVVDWQEQKALGLPQSSLQTRLLDKFGALNRDWRRLAITELGEAQNQGFISAMRPGDKVMRIEQYRSACAFCKKWHGAVLEVVAPDAPDKDWEKQVWLGKNNIGRSVAPMKRSGEGLIPRLESEMLMPAAGLFHPNCRGRWVVLPG